MLIKMTILDPFAGTFQQLAVMPQEFYSYFTNISFVNVVVAKVYGGHANNFACDNQSYMRDLRIALLGPTTSTISLPITTNHQQQPKIRKSDFYT